MEIIPQPNSKTIMKIYHPNHQLQKNDFIIISNSPSINQVPEKNINRKHIITKILSEDHYEVILNKYVPTISQNMIIPSIISIKYPDIFQMFFSFQDTLGNILNFDKVGEELAITPYRCIINNFDAYCDYVSDRQLKKLNMSGYNYFYIISPELITIQNTEPVSNVFAIIRWFENPGNVIFDSFVPSVKTYNTPLESLSELHITICHPDGRLVEFSGLDHSFTIEIIELYSQLNGTEINARINSDTDIFNM